MISSKLKLTGAFSRRRIASSVSVRHFSSSRFRSRPSSSRPCCQEPHAADAFPSLKDLGLSLPAQGCGFGFEGSIGERDRCGDMKGFRGLSEGFRKL